MCLCAPRACAALLGALTVAATSGAASAAPRTGMVGSAATVRLSHGTAPGAVNSVSSIEAFTGDGSIVALADGSVWFVAATGDRTTVLDWSVGDTTSVTAAAQLTDVDTGDSVTATPVGQTAKARPYTTLGLHRLLAMGDNGTVFALSDGSVWALSAPGAPSIADRWPIGSGVRVSRRAHEAYTLEDIRTDSHVPATYVGSER
jgi:hypothetical protein